MSTSGFVDAKEPSKNNAELSAPVKAELLFDFFFDGLTGCNAQKKMRDNYRSGGTGISALDEKNNMVYYNLENPNKEDVHQDADIIENYAFFLDAKPYNSQKKRYIKTIRVAKKMIKRYVYHFLSLSNVETIRIHTNIIGYNQGEIVGNIVYSIGEYDDDCKLSKEINQLFNFKGFLSHPKITYNKVDYIRLFDLCATTDTSIPLVGLTTGTGDFKDCKSKNTKKNNVDFDFPFTDKISVIDSIIMCQHTYDAQTPFEKSVIAYATSNQAESSPVGVGEEWVTLNVSGSDMTDVAENLNRSRSEFLWTEGDRKYVKTVGAWKTVSISDINGIGVDYKSAWSGLYSRLYKKVDENNKVQCYAYCTAGTEMTSVNDWVFANVSQGLTGISLQYSQSVRNAKKLDKYCKRKDIGVPLFFIGHSLGGGLASNNAIVTETRHAITFNAAGLSVFRVVATLIVNNPKALFKVKERKSRVHPFILEGEAVSKLKWIGQPAYGTKETTSNISLDNKIYIGGKDIELGEMNFLSRHALMNFLKLKDLDQLVIIQ